MSLKITYFYGMIHTWVYGSVHRRFHINMITL